MLMIILRELSSSKPRRAVELVRALDTNAIFGVIITPPITSLVFTAVWMSIYLRRTDDSVNHVDVQAVVTTAFTIASYLVTTGKNGRGFEV